MRYERFLRQWERAPVTYSRPEFMSYMSYHAVTNRTYNNIRGIYAILAWPTTLAMGRVYGNHLIFVFVVFEHNLVIRNLRTPRGAPHLDKE